MQTQVLIVGAGPTGLVLALWLARLGVRIRIVEKNASPGLASRAMVVQARTLEFYRQLGFAGEIVDGGIKMEQIHLREGSHEIAGFKFGDLGAGLSPFPFVLSYPQDEHERLLGRQLTAAGVEIEWNTELASFADDGRRVRATLRKNGTDEECEADYLCGCDGAHSAVRKDLMFDFPGGTYEQMFFVTDVQAAGEVANRDVNLCVRESAFCAVFPIRSTGMVRLIGIVPEELSGRQDISFEDVRPYVKKLIDVDVARVNWFSSYKVSHRVADHFRKGRCFICGDAGHVHSPVGGQGMNTGIGDAVNLSWKLAAVVQGRADASVLDTYESERIGFARTLVSTTDKVFQGLIGRGITARLFRSIIVPHVLPFALGFSAVRRMQFGVVSQTRINYRASALSEGSAGAVHGGDRLPWVADADNFEPLKSVEWQVHVYGTASQQLKDAAGGLGLALREFASSEPANDAGIKPDALYLVRPDGYVALADASQDVDQLKGFLSRFKIAPRRMPAERG